MGEVSPDNRDRQLLDQLLADARMYHTSADYQALMEFVAKLPGFAPFNAMLLHIQRPGLTYAAHADVWRRRFNRTIKEKAAPLLILWPFGPVSLVYDVQDTLGPDGSPELPKEIASFWASGTMTAERLAACVSAAGKRGVQVRDYEGGDGSAGQIRVLYRSNDKRVKSAYRVHLNTKHTVPTRFCTLAHELAHLCLGHLGEDKYLRIPGRTDRTRAMRELEAESVAYLVAARHGVDMDPKQYLALFTEPEMNTDDLDVYSIMRAAGHVEQLMDLLPQRARE